MQVPWEFGGGDEGRWGTKGRCGRREMVEAEGNLGSAGHCAVLAEPCRMEGDGDGAEVARRLAVALERWWLAQWWGQCGAGERVRGGVLGWKGGVWLLLLRLRRRRFCRCVCGFGKLGLVACGSAGQRKRLARAAA